MNTTYVNWNRNLYNGYLEETLHHEEKERNIHHNTYHTRESTQRKHTYKQQSHTQHKLCNKRGSIHHQTERNSMDMKQRRRSKITNKMTKNTHEPKGQNGNIKAYYVSR